MRTSDRILAALIATWSELPLLVGSAWPEVVAALAQMFIRLQHIADPDQRDKVALESWLVFKRFPRAGPRLAVAFQEASSSFRGPSDRDVHVRPWENLLWLFGRQVANEQTRFANVCFVEPDGLQVVTAQEPLTPGHEYELRFDIGALSPESALINPRQYSFPIQYLPRTTEGHWLDVIVISNDFNVSSASNRVFLPTLGASWVCGCVVDSTHTCGEGTRENYLYVRLTTPDQAGLAQLQLAIYYANNLVQSQLVTADIRSAAEPGGGYSSSVDFSLTAGLQDVEFLPPRTVNIMASSARGGLTHMVVVGGDAGMVQFPLNDGQIREAAEVARQALRDVAYVESGGQMGAQPLRTPLLDPDNAKSKEALLADLGRIAKLSWSSLAEPLLRQQMSWWQVLRDPATIQVARTTDSGFAFPWALVYDIPLESEASYEPCVLFQRWDQARGELLAGARLCPYRASHGAKNFLCPFGFWGFRHWFELMPSMPPGRNLATLVRTTDSDRQPVLVAGLSLKLDETVTEQHLALLRAQVRGFDVKDQRSLDQIKQALSDPVEVVYFYCHGRQDLPRGGKSPMPYLDVGAGQRLQPSDLTTWRFTDWTDEHWRNVSPLVFINGCHTVEMTPESLGRFVDAFVSVNAAGVLGTEVTLEQSFAGEAALQFFSYFQRPSTSVGEALHRMRLHFLVKGNLLGLAYTPYCSVNLALGGRGSKAPSVVTSSCATEERDVHC